MAHRRMLAKTILQDDRFLDMPFSSQALYMHLNIEADDDGFINGKRKVLTFLGATIEDFNTLVDNGYVIEFDTGVILIAHWNVHNYIQKDRYKPTTFQAEKSKVNLDENKVYTRCIQNVYNMYPQVNIELDKFNVGEYRDNSSNVMLSNVNGEKIFFGKHKNIPLSESEYTQYKARYNNIEEIINKYSEMVFYDPNMYKPHNFNCFLISQTKNSAAEAAPPNKV